MRGNTLILNDLHKFSNERNCYLLAIFWQILKDRVCDEFVTFTLFSVHRPGRQSILGTFESSLGSYRDENGRGYFFNNRSSLRRSRSTGTGIHSNPGNTGRSRAERQSKPLRASSRRTIPGSRTRSDDAPSPRASSVL